MKPKSENEYLLGSLEEWETAVFANASHFATYRRFGRMRNERKVFPTFAEALADAGDDRTVLVYAITETGRSALLVRGRWAVYKAAAGLAKPQKAARPPNEKLVVDLRELPPRLLRVIAVKRPRWTLGEARQALDSDLLQIFARTAAKQFREIVGYPEAHEWPPSFLIRDLPLSARLRRALQPIWASKKGYHFFPDRVVYLDQVSEVRDMADLDILQIPGLGRMLCAELRQLVGYGEGNLSERMVQKSWVQWKVK